MEIVDVDCLGSSLFSTVIHSMTLHNLLNLPGILLLPLCDGCCDDEISQCVYKYCQQCVAGAQCSRNICLSSEVCIIRLFGSCAFCKSPLDAL